MADTKRKILFSALRLFAVYGYEAVSVSQIAGELGITKGALYRHYKNKRDIFESIFKYVCQLDVERSQNAGIPEKEFSEMPHSFGGTSIESLKKYMISQFYYWSKDEIACNFRKMLTLEQYKTAEMNALYQKVLGSGPLEFIEDLFREMLKYRGYCEDAAKHMAVEFYSPFYLMLSICDATSNQNEKKIIADLYVAYVEQFMQKYSFLSYLEIERNKNETNY